MQICLIWILKWGVLPALESHGLPNAQGGATATPAVECFLAHFIRRAGNSSWKLCGPAVVQPRGSGQSWLPPEQSQYWAWKLPMLCTGRGLIEKAEGSSQPSKPESLFGKLRVAWSISSPSHPGREAETYSHRLWRVSSGAIWPEGWQNHLTAMWFSSTQAEERAGGAGSLQLKASGPVWLWEVRVQVSFWVKTTKSFTGHRAAASSVPRQGILICSPTHCLFHSPFNSPTYNGMDKTAHGVPVLWSRPGASPDQGNSVHPQAWLRPPNN